MAEETTVIPPSVHFDKETIVLQEGLQLLEHDSDGDDGDGMDLYFKTLPKVPPCADPEESTTLEDKYWQESLPM